MENTAPKQSTKAISPFLKTFLRPYSVPIFMALVALCITAAVTLGIGQSIKWLIDAGFGQNPSIKELNTTIILFLSLVTLLAIGTYTRVYAVSWLGERVSADIAKKVFARILLFDPSFFEAHSSGEMQSRIMNDATVLETVISTSLSSALRNVLLLVGGLILLVIANLKLTLFVLSLIPIVVLPILFFGKKVRTLSRDGQSKVAQVSAYLNETLGNIKTVQAYNHQSLDEEYFNTLVETAFSTAVARIKKRALLVTLVIVLIFGGIAGLIWIGGQDVALGKITGGSLAAFIFYAVIVAGSLGSLSEVYGDLQRAAGAIERLSELWNKSDSILLQSKVSLVAPTSPQTLQLENISFAYPSAPEHWVLQDVTLSIGSGETIAIVGPTGAGKTTIFEILLRFYTAQRGKIIMDGLSIDSIDPQTLRSYFALVSQEPQLFTGTVRDNIAYGVPGAAEKEIKDAAKTAYAHDFILALPQGYDTELGDKGIRLSGGQRQRIVIARALLKNPAILLLDEATSSLDAHSEHQVQLALEQLMQGRTTIVIAHRLSTVVNADRIIVLEEGRIIAIGTHETLLINCPLYAQLARLQLSKIN